MARYNLFLLDPTRDPRVIRRIAAQTGVDAGVLRSHLLRPPFLILRECTLSQSIQARRDLERLGLRLKLERLSPERITGNTRHPLARQAEQGGGSGEDEIILEEGEGLEEIPPDRPLRAEEPPEPSHRKRRRLPVLLLLLVLLLAGGWWFSRDAALPGEVRERLELAFDRLESRIEQLEETPDPSARRAILEDLQALRRQARSHWEALPKTLRSRLEELEARGRTLSLRGEDEAEPDAPPARLADFRDPTRGEEGGWQRLEHSLSSLSRPSTLRQAQDLFALVRLGQTPEESLKAFEVRRRQLVEDCRRSIEDLRARQLEASLRLKGAAILPHPAGARLLADLPDGSVLEVERGQQVHRVTLQDGQVLIEGLDALDPAIRFRLARIDEQPGPVRRILERGLEWMDPAGWYATRPGSTLPRRARLVRHQPGADPASLMLERELPGGVVLSSTGNFLDGAAPPEMPDAELRELMARCARAYLACRQWPEVVEFRRGETRFQLSGMDLWILSRDLL